jgi:hypothetical protein
MDSRGRLFVGDRLNQRIQVFDQNGRFLASWPAIMASGMTITAASSARRQFDHRSVRKPVGSRTTLAIAFQQGPESRGTRCFVSKAGGRSPGPPAPPSRIVEPTG